MLVSFVITQDVGQCMPTGSFNRWDYASEFKSFTPRQNKSRSFENMVLPYVQISQPDLKIDSNVITGRQRQNDCFSVDGVCNHCNPNFEAIGCFFYHYCFCQYAHPSSIDVKF